MLKTGKVSFEAVDYSGTVNPVLTALDEGIYEVMALAVKFPLNGFYSLAEGAWFKQVSCGQYQQILIKVEEDVTEADFIIVMLGDGDRYKISAFLYNSKGLEVRIGRPIAGAAEYTKIGMITDPEKELNKYWRDYGN